MVLSYKQFLQCPACSLVEETGSYPQIPRHQSEFLGHLMADTHDEPVSFIKEDKGGEEQHFDLLKHPGVHQTDPVLHKVHVQRYKALMKRGAQIAAKYPKIHARMSQGFRSYMAGVGQDEHWEDPRKTQRAALTESHKLLLGYQQQMGYANLPDLIRPNAKTSKNANPISTQGDQQAKLGKNLVERDMTLGLNLSPAGTHGMGGHTACARSTSACRANCLGIVTGQNAMLENINSKIARHHFFAEHPEHAARILHKELLNHIDKVAHHNATHPEEEHMSASYRPNMVTDYNHQSMSGDMIRHVSQYAKQRGVTFKVRDYTKHANYLYQKRPSNYFLALSHTGHNHDESNDNDVAEALNRGHTVAALYHGDATHMYDHKHGRFYPIVDGDKDDFIERRHAQVGHITMADGTGIHPATQKPTGVVSGMRIKGSTGQVKAKAIAGEFVSKTTTVHDPVAKVDRRVIEINKPGAK